MRVARASIWHNDGGARRVALVLSEEIDNEGEVVYRWRLKRDGSDCEVSARTYQGAIDAAYTAWGADCWDFRML